MTDDELDNKPVSDAEFAEFMRPSSFTDEIPIEKVEWGLSQKEAFALLDMPCRLTCESTEITTEPQPAKFAATAPLPLTQQELDDLLAEMCGDTPENAMNFDKAFEILLKHEGGYSNHVDDTGGATMWGITEAVARAHGYKGEMRNLPIEFAKQVYKATYWDAVKADELPAQVRYSVFDAAVNSGVNRATKWLQEAVGATADGVIGPKTLTAVRQQNPEQLNGKYNATRLVFLTNLSNWGSFGKGWTRRVASNLIGA